jgi:excisionase family DNA binding protein
MTEERKRRGRFFSVAEVAQRLGVCEKTIHRWMKAGKLRSHRLGGRRLISEADLEDFLDDGHD